MFEYVKQALLEKSAYISRKNLNTGLKQAQKFFLDFVDLFGVTTGFRKLSPSTTRKISIFFAVKIVMAAQHSYLNFCMKSKTTDRSMTGKFGVFWW